MSVKQLSPQPGLILNNIYRLERLLGKGGMGEVWLATHLLLNEPRAIKLLLNAAVLNPELHQRFIYGEAKNSLRLQHPHIVRVYDLGMDYNFPYIVMEYVAGSRQGVDLKQWLRLTGKLTLEQSTRLVAQIGEALIYAHQLNLIHRDVKPANILVTTEGDFKLADFGIVKDLQASSGFELTSPGLAVGTPAYISLEQAAGEADQRSDIYSLGVVLYEALTGSLPQIQSNYASLHQGHLTYLPLVPPDQLETSIPSEISRIILKALAGNPTNRYSSMLELVKEYQAAYQAMAQPATTEVSTFELAVAVEATSKLVPVVSDPAQHNLPTQPNYLLGRGKELAQLKALLLQPQTRLVTLTGTGGTGKTRLALSVAEALLTEFERVYFLGLETITQRPTFISELAATFGLADQPDRPLLDLVKANLAQRKTLLILDNFEQLLESGATLLPELLKSAADLSLLVTSRIPLKLSMEKEYSVAPLALPGEFRVRNTPGSLLEYAAIALFVARAKVVRPEFELTEENAVSCGEICRKLAGLPLAIELAAARVRAFSPQKILERLSLKLLTGGSRDLPTRQQTLRGAIDWSYDLLSPAEQRLFRRLSIFAGGFTLEAAEAVCRLEGESECEDVLDGIESLILKNLLQQKEVTAKNPQLPYSMLETIREYGLEKLAECDELASWQARYAAYYARLSRELEPSLHGAEIVAISKKLDAEYPNLREVLNRSLKVAGLSPQAGQEIAEALWWYWRSRGYLSEGRYYLEQALATVATESVAQRATLLNLLGDLCLRSGLADNALSYAEESLAIFRELDSPAGIAAAELNLGWIAACQGEFEAGISYLVESLKLFRATGDKRGAGTSLLNLGWIATNQGEFSRSTEYLLESLDLFREQGNKWGIGNALNMLGVVALNTTNYITANNYLEESLGLYREIGYKFGIATLLNNLGLSALCQGEYEVTESYFEESLILFRELDTKHSISNTLENLAATAIQRSEFARAFIYLEESLLLLHHLNNKRGILYSMADFMGLQHKYLLSLNQQSPRQTEALHYLACVAGIVEQLTQSGHLKLVEQPWVDYYKLGLEMAQAELAAEDFQLAFRQGQQFNLDELVQHALSVAGLIGITRY